MRIRSRLWRLRQDAGMTIDQLAERSGVPRSTVDKWGREGVPGSVAYAVRLADALGVGVRDLVCGAAGDTREHTKGANDGTQDTGRGRRWRT